ncbi:MAG: 50S ribosomal protein L25 [Chloroflexota bacterium]|nr:50S ribosomal protein L25 [Chloroflexota bacterium]
MKQDELKVSPREIKGKKVRFLRREGITPVNLYGPNIESVSLQADTIAVKSLLTKMGRNAIITLKIEGDKKSKKALLRTVQRDPLKGTLLHIDLFQADMSQKMRADVPITFVGEAPAARGRRGILVENLTSIHVEALPADLPQYIEVDISVLTELGQAIHVRDLNMADEIEVLNDPDQVIAKVMEARAEVAVEEEAPTPEEEAPEEAAGGGEAKAESE